MAQTQAVRPRQLVCRQPGCQKLFRCKKEMEQHWLVKHSNSIKQVTASAPSQSVAGSTKKVACNDCGKRFEYLQQLQQHTAAKTSHMQIGRGAHSLCCGRCPRENFSSIEALERHHAACHPVHELSMNNPERQEVEAYFKRKWLHKNHHTPTILSVMRIYNEAHRVHGFESYRKTLKVKANELRERDEKCLADGNEVRRFHGTTVHCGLGLNSSKLCSDAQCSLCGIIRNGFQLKKVRMDALQRYGKGIYCTATSSKADAYVRAETGLGPGTKVMLVCEVLAGRVYKTKEDRQDLLSPPSGFDSVSGEPGMDLKYDELVLYNENAILPRYIIIYKCA